MNRKPVSVVLAAFEGEKYIEQQVHSILRQLNGEDELIISVDPSQDHTEATLQRLKDDDSRIQILKGPGQGVVKNFENGLRRAKNPIVFLSDQDDVWKDGKVESIVREFDNPCVTCVVHDCSITDQNLNVVEDSYFTMHRSRPGFVRNILRNSFIGCCMAVGKDVIDAALPFPENIPMHDQWLGITAARKGTCIFLKQNLLFYRRHESNVSSLSGASLPQKLKWRVNLIKNLFLRG